MTRAEFFDEITYFCELRDFCEENEVYGALDDYFDGNYLDDEVESDLSEYDGNWVDLRDLLNDIRTGYDFYRRDGSFDYVACDDEDLYNLKESVANIIDERGGWDPDDEDEDEDDEEYEELDEEYVYQDPPQPELNEGMGFDELVGFEIVELPKMM